MTTTLSQTGMTTSRATGSISTTLPGGTCWAARTVAASNNNTVTDEVNMITCDIDYSRLQYLQVGTNTCDNCRLGERLWPGEWIGQAVYTIGLIIDLNIGMDEELLTGDEEFEMVSDNAPQSEDDIFFTHIVQALQEIVVDEEFQNNQAGFMRSHCHVFEPVEENKNEYMPIFGEYQQAMSTCLEKMLAQRVPGFDMGRFVAMLPARVAQIDEQIYEILTSLSDFEVFKSLMLDYKSSQQEQERLRVLTIKTTKAPEHKKVKGESDNIFSSKGPSFGSDGLTKKKSSGPSKKQKTQEEILVPDLVLTIRPLRKA